MQENEIKIHAIKDVKILLIKSNDNIVEKIKKKLSHSEKMELNLISSEKRKNDFVYTRYLKSIFFKNKKISYRNIGSPYFKNSSYNISISHSKNIYGFAFCKNHIIGLDIEYIRPGIQKIKHKFCNEKEMSLFTTDKNITQLWTIKEVLYKISNQKELSFVENINCIKSNFEISEGIIKATNKIIRAEITTFEFDEFLISVNTSLIYEI